MCMIAKKVDANERKQSMKTVECALTSEKLACLEERALGWVLSKEDHLLQRH